MRYLRFAIILSLIFPVFIIGKPVNAEDNKTLSNVLKSAKAPVSDITVINVFPHDQESFTEGLVYYQGYLYESTGLNSKSVLKKMEIQSGKVIKKTKLSGEYFGEGMTILNNKIYQLTWQHQTGFIYDLPNFREAGKFYYQGEGWGITTDGQYLIMSNGTSIITYLSPKTFEVIRKIKVHDGEMPVNNINELEFIHGEIWANIFMEDVIARISPQTGEILGWVNLNKIYSLLPESGKKDVLNGIAYDPENGRIFVTGKYWPKLFEIKIQN